MSRQRTWVELSQSALRKNFRLAESWVSPTTVVMPIVKANAYGHGLPEVVHALGSMQRPPKAFGVAYGEEALRLRAYWKGRIVVLSYWQEHELSTLIRQHIELVVWNWESLQSLLRLPPRTYRRAKLHIKIDTGTSRIGFLPEDIEELRIIAGHKRLHVVGLFSHFAHAEETSPIRTERQLLNFTTLADAFDPQRGITRHIACTAASIRLQKAQFGLVRLGIGLYGLSPAPTVNRVLKRNGGAYTPVMTWKTKIAQVKRVPAKTGIGYGASYVTKRRTTIATLPVGYADGYDRRLSNRGWVIIQGRRCPVVGRVCMNLIMVDVTGVSANVGDTVTLLGRGITADDMAGAMKTISYDVVTNIAWDIPRILV